MYCTMLIDLYMFNHSVFQVGRKNLIIAYDLLNVMLNSVCKNFDGDILCICSLNKMAHSFLYLLCPYLDMASGLSKMSLKVFLPFQLSVIVFVIV
jgi:hypothetical protein